MRDGDGGGAHATTRGGERVVTLREREQGAGREGVARAGRVDHGGHVQGGHVFGFGARTEDANSGLTAGQIEQVEGLTQLRQEPRESTQIFVARECDAVATRREDG